MAVDPLFARDRIRLPPIYCIPVYSKYAIHLINIVASARHEAAFGDARSQTRRELMKQIRLGAICGFALAASVLGGASIAGAEELWPEPTITAESELTPSEAESEPTPSEGASLLEGCEANKICIFASPTYNNWSAKFACSLSGAYSIASYSATNRCGNKTNWLRVNGTSIACMNPGGNRPHPGLFNEVYIAAEYGAFC